MRAGHRQLLLSFACLLWCTAAEEHKLPSGLPANALQPWRSDVAGASTAWKTRRLQQQPALSPGPAQPATGSAVVSIISNSTNYWPYLCVDSCSQVRHCTEAWSITDFWTPLASAALTMLATPSTFAMICFALVRKSQRAETRPTGRSCKLLKTPLLTRSTILPFHPKSAFMLVHQWVPHAQPPY